MKSVDKIRSFPYREPIKGSRIGNGMRLVGRQVLRNYIKSDPQTEEPIACWVAVMKGNDIHNEDRFKTLFPNARRAGSGLYMFRYAEHAFEIMARVHFQNRIVIIEAIK